MSAIMSAFDASRIRLSHPKIIEGLGPSIELAALMRLKGVY